MPDRQDGEDELTFAKRRLKQGASDAEVRLELLDQGVPADRIEVAMRVAVPRRSVSMPWLFAGLGLAALAACVFLASAASLLSGGPTTMVLPKVFGLLAAAAIARGLMPRG